MSDRLQYGGMFLETEVVHQADGAWYVQAGATKHLVQHVELHDGELSFELEDKQYRVHVLVRPGGVVVADGRGVYRLELVEDGAPETLAGPGNGLVSQMPGKVLALLAAPGQQVAQGQPLLILEAMKMEHEICAPAEGVVRGYPLQPGERVMPGSLLVDFEPL